VFERHPSPHVAAFDCDICGKRAMRLILPTEPAAPRDHGEPPDADQPAPFPRGPDFLELDSDLGRTAFRVAEPDGPPRDRLLAAFESRSAADFYALNLEYAPNWCPRCAVIYCREHWRTWLEFDPEMPWWIEEIRGECPYGHERMLSD
jgi:hypothetical protein